MLLKTCSCSNMLETSREKVKIDLEILVLSHFYQCNIFYEVCIYAYLCITLCLGKAIGSLISGYAWDTFGSRRSLQIWAIANVAVGSIYALLHVVWLRRFDVSADKDESTENLIAEDTGIENAFDNDE